jgi:hypothetical protein
VAGETDSAEDVGLEDAEPVGVGDVGEGFGLVDAEIIDEDVGVGDLSGEGLCAYGGGWVGDDGFSLLRPGTVT